MKKDIILKVDDSTFSFGQQTWMMGILNVTPDSFSDGGLYFDRKKAVEKSLEMIEQGADIIDIGGESSRPGSDPVSADEEIRRVIPVIKELRKQTDILISIDTTKSSTAAAALDIGADIINDISALKFDSRMADLAAERRVPVILMHMKGTPKTMQNNPTYEDVLQEIKDFFIERMKAAAAAGIDREKIILDPGIGFGKRIEDNLTLINNIGYFHDLERPILMGVSRKSFIGKILDLTEKERLEGTIASALMSWLNGAHILRVHDVAPVRRAIRIADSIIKETIQTESNREVRPNHGI